jgi:hypothetical protein
MEVIEAGAFSERFLVHDGISPVNLFGLMPYHGHGCGAGDAGTFQVTYGGAAETVELETTFQNQRAR